MPGNNNFVYDYASFWGVLVQELIDAKILEAQLIVNAFLAERLFPRIAG